MAGDSKNSGLNKTTDNPAVGELTGEFTPSGLPGSNSHNTAAHSEGTKSKAAPDSFQTGEYQPGHTPSNLEAVTMAQALRGDAKGAAILRLGDKHYRLENKLLGQGGQGRVMLARDRLNRLVAIKEANPDNDGSINIPANERLFEEAQTIASLEHTNIVPIYSVEQEGDSLWFVYKYIKGGTLEDKIKTKPSTTEDKIETKPAVAPREAANLVMKMANALAFVHDHGLCHRDVKPANILIDESNNPYLADFGVAMPLAEDRKPKGSDQCAGTISYMSPEQAAAGIHLEGKGEVDHRSDIFSLGIVLHEILSGGKQVFPREKGMSDLNFLNKVARSQRIAAPQNDDVRVPPELRRICLKALEIDPNKRYQSAAHMAHDLQSFLDRKSKTPIVVGTTLALAGSIGFGGLLLSRDGRAQKENPADTKATAPADVLADTPLDIKKVIAEYKEAANTYRKLGRASSPDEEGDYATLLDTQYNLKLPRLLKGSIPLEGRGEVVLTSDNFLSYVSGLIKEDSVKDVTISSVYLNSVIEIMREMRDKVITDVLTQTPQKGGDMIYGMPKDNWNNKVAANPAFEHEYPAALETLGVKTDALAALYDEILARITARELQQLSTKKRASSSARNDAHSGRATASRDNAGRAP